MVVSYPPFLYDDGAVTMATTTKLPTELINELKRSERALMDLLPELDKAEQCGIDCQEYRTIRDEAVERISKLLQHFA